MDNLIGASHQTITTTPSHSDPWRTDESIETIENLLSAVLNDSIQRMENKISLYEMQLIR